MIRRMFFTLLYLAVLLTGCTWTMPPNPTPTPIPTPQSQQISEFVWQRDGDYAYAMLRPASWLAANEGTGRVYYRLVAYGIDQSTPFEIILNVGGQQALLEEIDQTGLMDDFITMVESFRAAP